MVENTFSKILFFFFFLTHHYKIRGGSSTFAILGLGWTRLSTLKAREREREREREDLKGKRKLGIVIQSYKVGFPIHENVTPKPNPKSIYFFLKKI